MLKKNTLNAQVSNDLVHVHHNKPFTDSLIISREFGKRHPDVTEKIRAGLNSKDKEISEFSLRNFRWSDSITERGKTYPIYEITEDGFLELGMSFTGEKAKKVRIRFIAEFRKALNEITHLREQRLSVDWQEARANSKCIRKIATGAYQSLERLADKQGGIKNKPENRHYYETITRMINKQLFGDGTLKNVRDKLDGLQLQFLAICEQVCADEIHKLVELELDYHTIYSEVKKRVIATVDGLSKTRLTSPSSIVKLAWENAEVNLQ